MGETEAANFPGVIGHRRTTTMLSRAIARSRLHHGLVFVGPRGIGKSALARGLACALICEVAPAIGCGHCDPCRRLLSGRHTDLQRLDGEGKSRMVKIEASREVALRAQHAPFESKAHVIVVDPIDRLSNTTAGVMLKPIEEPREGVFWVLLATNLHDVEPTILSRCMTIPIEALGDEDVRRVVEAELKRRELAPAPEQIAIAISLAEGSPGVALELLVDPSLEPTRTLLASSFDALNQGPSAVFAGDRSPLWVAWKEAVAATPEPTDETPVLDEGEVIVVSGGKGKKSTKKKAAKLEAKSSEAEGESAGSGKESSARQRATASRLAELWLLHVRERVRGHVGLAGLPELALPATRQMTAVQRFQTGLAANPNVRLSLEQLLLELGR